MIALDLGFSVFKIFQVKAEIVIKSDRLSINNCDLALC